MSVLTYMILVVLSLIGLFAAFLYVRGWYYAATKGLRKWDPDSIGFFLAANLVVGSFAAGYVLKLIFN